MYVQDTEEAESVSEHYEDLRYAEPDLVCTETQTSLSAVAGVYTRTPRWHTRGGRTLR